MVSGDGQQGAAGTTLGAPLVVEVTDAFGNPIAGKRITWTVEGGGSVNDPSTITDADGRSSVLRTLGPASGSQTTTASSEGLAGSPVIFTHTVTAGNASSVRIVSGNEQVALPGTTLPQPLVVEVVDGGGNAVVGAAVTWVVTAGAGSLAPPTGTTDENGRASTSWTLGAGTGANAAQAVVSGVGEATFTATASAGNPADIRIVSGDEQQGQAGTRLANPLVVVGGGRCGQSGPRSDSHLAGGKRRGIGDAADQPHRRERPSLDGVDARRSYRRAIGGGVRAGRRHRALRSDFDRGLALHAGDGDPAAGQRGGRHYVQSTAGGPSARRGGQRGCGGRGHSHRGDRQWRRLPLRHHLADHRRERASDVHRSRHHRRHRHAPAHLRGVRLHLGNVRSGDREKGRDDHQDRLRLAGSIPARAGCTRWSSKWSIHRAPLSAARYG